MHPISRNALEKLLDKAVRATARGSTERVALSMREGTMPQYRALRSITEKDAVETDLRLAQQKGAVVIDWELNGREGDFIKRLTLADERLLAAELGVTPRANVLSTAFAAMEPYMADAPALREVFERWQKNRPVRARGPEHAPEFVDAARALMYLKSHPGRDALIRVASVAIFQDSKRLEALGPALDALTAETLEAPPRPAFEVFAELGLVRQPMPVMMAGAVRIRRERASTPPDRPYAAYPSEAVLGLDEQPVYILVIENLTTFHQVAPLVQDLPALAVYCGGMPSPSWREMFERLLAGCSRATKLFHWGDIDEGGFRIAAAIAAIARRHQKELQPWLMSPATAEITARVAIKDTEAARMAAWARRAGWDAIAEEVSVSCIAVEQEGIAPRLPVAQ